MSEFSRQMKAMREQLRAYLLGTLPETERARVEARLADSEDLRAQLEAERTALARLDALPRMEPRTGLAAQVMGELRAREAEAEGNRSAPGRRVLGYGVAIAAGLVLVLSLLPALSRGREAARRATSANTLKQVGVVLKMYANDNPGAWFPPLAPQDGVWGLDVSVLYPRYLADPKLLIDPSHPRAEAIGREMDAAMTTTPIDWAAVNRLAAESYTYLGWHATSPEELVRLRDARPQRLGQRAELARNFESDTGIYRLREGIERFFITDINNPAASASVQSGIPVMFETRSRIPGGRNVLFMDGHVEFIRYGEAFPVTGETDAILGINAGR